MDFFGVMPLIRSKIKSQKKRSKKELMSAFYNSDEHKWIRSDAVLVRSFELFWEMLSEKNINKMAKLSNLSFVCIDHGIGAHLSKGGEGHYILIDKKVMNYLRCVDPSIGIAAICYQIGSILAQARRRKVTSLEWAVEADQFVMDCGLASEMAEIVERTPHGIERNVRLSYLTSFLAKDLAPKK
jgi:hypothetical protein